MALLTMTENQKWDKIHEFAFGYFNMYNVGL